MTAPREILPGRTYLLSRRCTQRQFLLRPDEKTNATFDYALAEAADRHGIELIGWVAMSNHYHAIVHDPAGRLPAFLEHLHKMLAKALNVRWRRWENLWATEQTCATYLPTLEEVFDKLVYVLTNPISGHLVDRLVHWPGSTSLHHLDGRTTFHERPKWFFREDGRMPASVPLRALQPRSSQLQESADVWATRVREAVAERERTLLDLRAREGIRVLGRRVVLTQSAFSSPTTSERRRNLRPRLACKDKQRRIELLADLKGFLTAYFQARLSFESGEYSVEFPAGTYRLRAWRVRCVPFPAPA